MGVEPCFLKKKVGSGSSDRLHITAQQHLITALQPDLVCGNTVFVIYNDLEGIRAFRHLSAATG